MQFFLNIKEDIGSDPEEEIKITWAREMSLEAVAMAKACVRAGDQW